MVERAHTTMAAFQNPSTPPRHAHDHRIRGLYIVSLATNVGRFSFSFMKCVFFFFLLSFCLFIFAFSRTFVRCCYFDLTLFLYASGQLFFFLLLCIALARVSRSNGHVPNNDKRWPFWCPGVTVYVPDESFSGFYTSLLYIFILLYTLKSISRGAKLKMDERDIYSKHITGNAFTVEIKV